MQRRLLIAANWKMHPAPAGAFLHDSPYQTHADVDVMVFPSLLDLAACIEAKIIAGPQYAHSETAGAHTGDVSMQMCKAIGARCALCGHSDRRMEHRESNEQIAAQAVAALENGLHPIICIGETLEERKAGKAHAVVRQQMKPLPLESDITLAYEPVWAISRGDPSTPAATPLDAQEMHAFIRSLLPKHRSGMTNILYGGSMKIENCEELLRLPDIDGGLVGGASLKPDQFRTIIETASRLRAK